MANHRLNRVVRAQSSEQVHEADVLHPLEWQLVTALQFDTERKIVAARSPLPGRDAGMPGALAAGDKLDQLTTSAHKKMGRDQQSADLRKIGISSRIKPVGEQLHDPITTELPGRQADRMNDDQRDKLARRPFIVVGRTDTLYACEPSVIPDPWVNSIRRRIHSSIPSRSMR